MGDNICLDHINKYQHSICVEKKNALKCLNGASIHVNTKRTEYIEEVWVMLSSSRVATRLHNLCSTLLHFFPQ